MRVYKKLYRPTPPSDLSRIGEAERLEITCGVPQGSVHGPILWNVYYDGVLRMSMPEGVTIIAYADDLALVIEEESGRISNKKQREC